MKSIKNLHIFSFITGFLLSYYSYLPHLWQKLSTLANYGVPGVLLAGTSVGLIALMVWKQYEMRALSKSVGDSVKNLSSLDPIVYKVFSVVILVLTIAGTMVTGYVIGNVLRHF